MAKLHFSLYNEPVLPFDKEPLQTKLYFRHNKEELPMNIKELCLNLIEHADDVRDVVEIDLNRAAEIVGWMDPDSGLPEGLTPEAFMEVWNALIRSGNYNRD